MPARRPPSALAHSASVQIVVGAAIVDRGRVLAAQRAAPARLAGAWEFPGGKVEPGETDEAALVRECREELAVEVALSGRLGTDIALPVGGTVLRVWTARIVAGTPVAVEHRALRWLGVDELFDVAWLPADRPLVRELRGVLTAG